MLQIIGIVNLHIYYKWRPCTRLRISTIASMETAEVGMGATKSDREMFPMSVYVNPKETK